MHNRVEYPEKAMVAARKVLPETVTARQHRKQAEPGSANA